MRVEGIDQLLASAQMQQTGIQKVLAPNTSQQSGSSVGGAQASISSDKVSIKVDLPQHTVDTLQKMGNISDLLNSMATNLRQTNNALTAASAITEKMKAALDKIIKNYPPYPPDSKERMEQLMSYASLKKEITSMMIPPPPPPIYENVKHLWEGLTNGTAGNTIQTPNLPQNAPDSHVMAASKQLDVISGQIGLVQDSMSSSVRTS